MTRDLSIVHDVERYRPLGLLADPFATPVNATDFDGVELETVAAANELLGRILEAARQEKAKPIAVMKSDDVPQFYALRAVGETEQSLASDDGVGVLHAYVQLFMMRLGRVRSIISILAERLAFRDFDKTLECYVADVLQEPDTGLVSYQVLGEEQYRRFEERFAAEPSGTVRQLFGSARVERRPELQRVVDTRFADLQSDVEEDEALPEIDSSITDSPANAILLAESERAEDESNDQAMVDYIVEHTKAHLSPVVARALRVYRERGLAAMAEELKITKAPKKTLAAIVRLARSRFAKVALIFDGFELWYQVPAETRSLIAGTLSEIRWMLESDAVMVFMLESGEVPELEEQFGGGTRLEWGFSGLAAFEKDPQVLDATAINSWLARANLPGTEPLTMDDPVLSALMSDSEGFSEFAFRAATAVEDAADRAVISLDEEALNAARVAQPAEANMS